MTKGINKKMPFLYYKMSTFKNCVKSIQHKVQKKWYQFKFK